MFDSSIIWSSPGSPNIRRLRSIEPTAMYLASAPNFTEVTLPVEGHVTTVGHQCAPSWDGNQRLRQKRDIPVPDKSGNVLIRFHSTLTLPTW